MALLSTSSRLIKVGQDYSAGSGISINDHVISVTGEFGKVYSAGENISIDGNVINSKDWTGDINAASAYAYEQAVAQIPDPFDPTFLSGEIDNKLNSTAFTTWQNGQYSTDLQTIEGQITNKLDTSSFSDVSASFLTAINIPESATWNEVSQAYEQASGTYLTAHQSLDGYATENWVTAQGYLTGIDLSNYYNKSETSGAEQLADAFANIPGGAGDVEVNALVHSNSAEWNEVSSKLDESTFQQASGLFLTAIPQEYITESDIPNFISAKLDTTAFADVSGTFLTAHQSLEGYATEQFVEDTSASITALIPSDYYPTSNPSGFITGVDLSNYYQKNETSSKEEISAAIAAIPLGDEEVNQAVHTNSGTWNTVTDKLDTTSFSDVSGSFLTAHQSLDGYATETLVEETSGAITSLIPTDYYPDTNPSGFISGVDLTPYQTIEGMTAYQPVGDYATTAEVDTLSSMLSGAIDYVSANVGGGGTTYTSPSGTILINGNALEASKSAIGTVIKTANASLNNSYFSAIPGYPFDSYSAQSTGLRSFLTLQYGDWGDGFTVYDAMTANIIEIPLTSGGYDLWLYNGEGVRLSAVKSGVLELVNKDDLSDYATIVDRNNLSASISSVSSNLYGLSGKTFSGSKLGTIIVEGQNIEGSTSAVTQVADTAATTFSNTVSVNTLPNYPYTTYKYSFGQYTNSVQVIYGNYTHTEIIDGTPQSVITIPSTYDGYNLTMVGFGEGVLSGIKSDVVELALKNDIPTYEYDSSNKISAINGSALAVVGEFPASADEAITTYQNNSATYLTAHQAISAGPGIKVNLVDNTLVFSNDETVLWETTAYNGAGTINLSEPYTNFKKLKVLAVRGNADQATPYAYSGPWWEYETDGIITGTYKAYGSLSPAIFERQFWKYSVYSATNTTTFVYAEGGQKNILSTAAGTASNTFTNAVGIKKIIGIGRKN